jgi:hypothetical protein
MIGSSMTAQVPERLDSQHGDFIHQLRQSFFAPGLYIPFRNGLLVTNHIEWLCDMALLELGAGHESFRPFDLDASWMPAWPAFSLE